MREDKHNVRVTFKHGNAITVDAKGCGQIYLEPNHDYFFENAPMQFINYLPQLKRLGVTYKLTNDKRGCYQTFNLACYYANNPYTMLQGLRSNKSADAIVHETEEPIQEVEEAVITDETPASILGNDKLEEATKEDEVTETKETIVEDNKTTETEVTESNEEVQATETEESTEPVDIETLSKPNLISYAKKLGLTEVTDYWTKKEIKEAITKKLAE